MFWISDEVFDQPFKLGVSNLQITEESKLQGQVIVKAELLLLFFVCI